MVYFIGIENEFEVFSGFDRVKFDEVWQTLLNEYRQKYFLSDDKKIRTKTGAQLYADNSVAEVCTAPALIRKGFATDVTNDLYNARKMLLEFTSSLRYLKLVGYSTHWNISNHVPMNKDKKQLLEALCVPYALFTENLLSSGVAFKEIFKLEFKSDYIDNLDQVNAFLIFFAGTMLNINSEIIDSLPQVSVSGNPVIDGRHTRYDVIFKGKEQNLTAQSLLELYFYMFRDCFIKIATVEEMKNLEDFVSGKNKLEVDCFKKYAFLSTLKIGRRLLPHEETILDASNYDSYTAEIFNPTTRFLSDLVRDRYEELTLKELDWDKLKFRLDTTEIKINSLEAIDLCAYLVSKKYPFLFSALVSEKYSTEPSKNNFYRYVKKMVSNNKLSFNHFLRQFNSWKRDNIFSKKIKKPNLPKKKMLKYDEKADFFSEYSKMNGERGSILAKLIYEMILKR